jgi:ABC-type phosphate transport system substrate-binding protein
VFCVIVNVSFLAASSIGHVIHQQIDYGARQTVASIMRTDKLTAALNSGDVAQLPLFAVTIAQIYSLPGMSSSEGGIIMDFELISDIWMGKITTWDHPRIKALNPIMDAANRLPALNITRVISNAGERESERLFFYSLYGHTVGTTSPYNISYDKYGVPEHFYETPWLINGPASNHIVVVGSEQKVQAAVNNIPGSIGTFIATINLETTVLSFVIVPPPLLTKL